MNKIINKQNAPNYTWGNNCLSWILNDSETLSIKQEMMPAKMKEQLHFHENAKQFFYILKGHATFYLADKVFMLNPNDGLSVVNKTKHFIANESNETLEFLVISQPSTNNDRIDL